MVVDRTCGWKTERDLRVERVIQAPPALGGRCLALTDLLRRWWVAVPVVNTDKVIEPRPCGRFVTQVLMRDGADHVREMTMLRADERQRLVFTDLITAGVRPLASPMFGFSGDIALTAPKGGTACTATARHAHAEKFLTPPQDGLSRGPGDGRRSAGGSCPDVLSFARTGRTAR